MYRATPSCSPILQHRPAASYRASPSRAGTVLAYDLLVDLGPDWPDDDAQGSCRFSWVPAAHCFPVLDKDIREYNAVHALGRHVVPTANDDAVLAVCQHRLVTTASKTMRFQFLVDFGSFHSWLPWHFFFDLTCLRRYVRQTDLSHTAVCLARWAAQGSVHTVDDMLESCSTDDAFHHRSSKAVEAVAIERTAWTEAASALTVHGDVLGTQIAVNAIETTSRLEGTIGGILALKYMHKQSLSCANECADTDETGVIKAAQYLIPGLLRAMQQQAAAFSRANTCL